MLERPKFSQVVIGRERFLVTGGVRQKKLAAALRLLYVNGSCPALQGSVSLLLHNPNPICWERTINLIVKILHVTPRARLAMKSLDGLSEVPLQDEGSSLVSTENCIGRCFKTK